MKNTFERIQPTTYYTFVSFKYCISTCCTFDHFQGVDAVNCSKTWRSRWTITTRYVNSMHALHQRPILQGVEVPSSTLSSTWHNVHYRCCKQYVFHEFYFSFVQLLPDACTCGYAYKSEVILGQHIAVKRHPETHAKVKFGKSYFVRRHF